MNKFQRYFQDKVLSVRKLNHQGNNQLFEVMSSNKKYLLKKYSTIQKDNWDRGETEFRTISYLWKKGFREISEPIISHKQENIGVYSFEEGKCLKPEEIIEQDIIQAANFLAKIHNLNLEDKNQFPLERTSCLCISDYLKLIETRVKNISEDFAGNENSKHFWDNQIIQKVKELKISISKQELDLDKELSLENQVITPGDFGFHNMLKSNGKYIFLDFEYCGRDDSVKQILDFLHHDKTIPISRDLKQLFLDTYTQQVIPTKDFYQRLKLVDPLIGMNWVLIYLNPLSKKYQQHMQFAGHENINKIIEGRLKKAEKKLNRLNFFD